MRCRGLLQDLKTGHLLGASPRAQFIAQIVRLVLAIREMLTRRARSHAHSLGAQRGVDRRQRCLPHRGVSLLSACACVDRSDGRHVIDEACAAASTDCAAPSRPKEPTALIGTDRSDRFTRSSCPSPRSSSTHRFTECRSAPKYRTPVQRWAAQRRHCWVRSSLIVRLMSPLACRQRTAVAREARAAAPWLPPQAQCDSTLVSPVDFGHRSAAVPGPEFPAPTAAIWVDMAKLVTGGEVSPTVTPFCIVAALIGASLSERALRPIKLLVCFAPFGTQPCREFSQSMLRRARVCVTVRCRGIRLVGCGGWKSRSISSRLVRR
jgi:hypothetical protein